ncbi:MAG: adenylate cyclase [Frankiaceae bacterium]|jgi:adenylate cyclase|nr:adenylate cyclase [Frankiaceae bacterium]
MADDRDAMFDEVGAAIVGAPHYNRAAVAAAAGVPVDFADRLWRAMGFPDAPDDLVLFTERDVAALRTAESLRAYGVVDEAGLLTLTRAMAQSLSRLAVSHADVAASHLAPSDAEALVPAVGSLLDYVWRRHLAAAAEGALVTAAGERPADRPVAVGFADLAGFTELSRQVTPDELAALVERFEQHAATAVAAHGGRVVKTLGDEVLFALDDVGAATALGLALAAGGEQVGREVAVGVAYGPVLARLGDVFGPTVNIASRLTGLARPGTVLLDREAATALRGDPRFDIAPLRRHAVRGYTHLAPFRVRAATKE